MNDNEGDARHAKGFSRTWDYLRAVLGPLAALLGVIVLFTVADFLFADGTFGTFRNLRTITVQTCVIAVAALGMTLIVISGGIDLSAGTALSLAATVLAWGLREDIAVRVWHGDNFATASAKLEAAQQAVLAQQGQADSTASSREQFELRKMRLKAILVQKLEWSKSQLEEVPDDERARLQSRIASLESKLQRLDVPDLVFRNDRTWQAGVPNSAWSAYVALAMGMLAGVGAGLLNGFLISSLRVVPFIITLGTMTIYLGLGNMLSGSVPIRPSMEYHVPPWLSAITRNTPDALYGGFPYGVWMALILGLLLALVLRYSVFGRYVFALGSNESTARLCGINVAKYKIAVYALAGLFIGIAGVYQFSRLTVGNPQSGLGLELRIIAAVVIGGGSLSGGRGAVLGTLTGAAIMAVIASGCTQLGVENPVQDIILGTIIVGAVTLDQVRQRRWSRD
jgi:ribose transport system permease protein